MLLQMTIGAAAIIALFLLWRQLQFSSNKGRTVIGFAALGLLIAGTVVKLVVDRNDEGTFTTAAISSNAVQAGIQAVPSSTQIQNSTQVEPVPSLIGGLEQRLQAEPDDVRGWALLAQSYAFTGQANLAESALERAVTLGFDEAELRQRVASATRSPHAGLTPFDPSGE